MNRRFLLVAILLAGLSAALVYAKISAGGDDGGGSSGAAGDQTVVVARTEIKQRTTVTRDMLEVKSVPLSAAITGAYENVADVEGKVTKFPIAVNQQISSSAVIDTEHPTSDAALALVVPDGKRGFSITASQVVTAGGLLLPGDYVDVVWVCCPKGIQFAPDNEGANAPAGTNNGAGKTDAIILARSIVQNVQVVAVQQQIVSSGPVEGEGGESDPVASDQGKEIPEAVTITLLVTPEQAQVLLMGESTGELRAALRSPGDEAIFPAVDDFELVVPGLITPDILNQLRPLFNFGPATQ